MSQVLLGARLFVAGADLSGDASAMQLDYGADALQADVLGQEHRKVGGLKHVSLGYRGLWGAGSTRIDATVFEHMGTSDVPVTACPAGSTVGTLTYTLRALHTRYTQGGSIGELYSVGVQAEGDGGLYRGKLLANTSAAVSTGDAVQVGGSSGGTVGAAVHVLDSTGCGDEALTVTIQTAASSAFSAPSTAITLVADMTSAAGDSTGVFGTGAGTTQDWMRTKATVTGSTTSYYPASTTAGLWTSVATSSDTGLLFSGSSGLFGFDDAAGITALTSAGLVVLFTSAANASPSFGYVVAAGVN